MQQFHVILHAFHQHTHIHQNLQARPRELVLKERGIDDVVINSYDMFKPSNQVDHIARRGKKFPNHPIQSHRAKKNRGMTQQHLQILGFSKPFPVTIHEWPNHNYEQQHQGSVCGATARSHRHLTTNPENIDSLHKVTLEVKGET